MALDTTAQDLCEYKNWTGLTLRELVEAGRLPDAESVHLFLKTPIDDAIDRAMTRILEVPNRKKPYLDWDEARLLYAWGERMKREVVMLMGFSWPA